MPTESLVTSVICYKFQINLFEVLIFYIFFHDFIHVYSSRAGADIPLGMKFWCQQEPLVTLVICCKFKPDFIVFFSIILYMYIAPGQTAPRRQSFDVNRYVLSLHSFGASLKKMSLKSDFIQFFSSPEPKAHKVSLKYTNGPPSVVVVHTFKLEYLWSQLANLDQILCVASLGWGKGCIRFWGRLDQNSGQHGNRKAPLTYNGENDVSTFSRLLLIRSVSYLQVTRTCIKSRKVRISARSNHWLRS